MNQIDYGLQIFKHLDEDRVRASFSSLSLAIKDLIEHIASNNTQTLRYHVGIHNNHLCNVNVYPNSLFVRMFDGLEYSTNCSGHSKAVYFTKYINQSLEAHKKHLFDVAEAEKLVEEIIGV